MAKLNMIVDEHRLLHGWDTNCVPVEVFSRPHPPWVLAGEEYRGSGAISSSLSSSPWAGGVCWLGHLSPDQQRTLHDHFAGGLTFLASEGALPDQFVLDSPFVLIGTFRSPQVRTLSSYYWWQDLAMRFGPYQAPLCGASYFVPNANATLAEFLTVYPDNWQTRTLLGRSYLLERNKDDKDAASDTFIDDVETNAALTRLHYFDLVLIVEDLPGSLALLRKKLGWTKGDWDTERKGSRRDKDENLLASSSWEGRRLQDMHRQDQKVYDAAVQLHCRQLEEEGLRSTFCDSI